MASPVDAAPGEGRLQVVRAKRAAVRRAVQLARIRAQQGGPADGLAEGEAELAALTGELIEIYRADITLVDSLLDPAYPADVEGRGTP